MEYRYTYIFVFVLSLTVQVQKFYAQYDNIINLEMTSDKGATDFYHITKGFNSTEQKSITYIAQDSIGQIWLATKEGVVRYDGKNLFPYKKEVDNPYSIGGVFVERVFVGKDGSVWIGTEPAVLSKYRPETNDFETIKGIAGDRIKDIKQDKDSLYWITSNRTLYSYDDRKKELKIFTFKDNKVGLDRLLITSQDHIYIGTNEDFILEFDRKSGSFHKINILGKHNIYHTRNTRYYTAFHFVEDYLGYIWITTPYGYLLRYNPELKTITKYIFADLSNELVSLDHKKLTIMFIMEDNKHNLWFGSWFNGLYMIPEDRKVIRHIMPSKGNPNTLNNNIIHSGFQDKAGYLWFGTEFAGLNILNKNKKFNLIKHCKHSHTTLPLDPVISVAVDGDNTVYVGTLGSGLYYFNKESPHIINKSNIVQENKIDIVSALLYDTQGNLWIGLNSVLIKYNPKTRKKTYYKKKKNDYNSLIGNSIMSIVEDQDYNIWIGTNSGLCKFDANNNKFYRFSSDKDNPKSLSDNEIRALYCDSKNDIWVGTFRGGINKFNKETGNFTAYKHNYKSNSIGANRINCIYEFGGYLWIGTQGGGLNRYDYNNKLFKIYNVESGFISDNIEGINSDKHGNLWLSTTNNLVLFNPETEQSFTYGKSDGLENQDYIRNMGLQDLEFSNGLAYRDKDDYLYFGGTTGLTIFHPDSLPSNKYIPPIIISKFLVNGKTYPLSKEVILEPRQNEIELSTAVLNYMYSDKNQYAFYLQNYDSAWHFTGNINRTVYHDLPKGKYKLHYKGSNNDNVWNINAVPLNITIKPQFYETSYFYTLLGFLVLIFSLSTYIYNLYLNKKIKERKRKLKYSGSSLEHRKAEEINEKLQKELKTNKLYLDADLSLQKLAIVLGVKPNHLSQVINQLHQQNFNEFVNTYRIKEAKKLLIKATYKIEAIAYESGFNSISTFNAFFKKNVGMTPSAFKRKHKNKN